MRALKLLVIGMAVVIVIATAALIAIIVQRAGERAASGPVVADRPIMVPDGFRVTSTDLSGDRLLIRLEGREPGASADEIRLMTVELDRGGAARTVRLMLPRAEGAR